MCIFVSLKGFDKFKVCELKIIYVISFLLPKLPFIMLTVNDFLVHCAGLNKCEVFYSFENSVLICVKRLSQSF